MKKGSHHSEETKRRMTLSHSGVKNHMYGKTGEHHPCFGSHLSEETKEKIAATKRGKPRPPHVKAKLLAAHVGVSPSEETRAIDDNFFQTFWRLFRGYVFCPHVSQHLLQLIQAKA